MREEGTSNVAERTVEISSTSVRSYEVLIEMGAGWATIMGAVGVIHRNQDSKSLANKLKGQTHVLTYT